MTLLSSAKVVHPSSSPERWIVFLHGILGSGSNWRSFARQVVAERPTWGALLVDLRLHGQSVGFSPPHTIAAAAGDVVDLVATLPGPASAILGHSFGGKVAIEVAGRLADPLAHLFVVDSTPSARVDERGSESTRHIVELLTSLPDAFPDRDAFVSWVSERGVSRPVAMWLAMNVKPEPNTTRFTFRIDLAGVRALLDDYFRRDVWSVIEQPWKTVTHLIVGERSGIVDRTDMDRARRSSNVTVDVVEGAGHWVHVDAPDVLRRLVVERL